MVGDLPVDDVDPVVTSVERLGPAEHVVELLLGLPPMTQHDAAAPPMVNSFMAKPDLSGFTAVPARIDLMTKNPAQGYGATASARMDFSDYDRIDEDALNRVL